MALAKGVMACPLHVLQFPPRAAVANPHQPAMLPVDDEVDHDLQASEEDDAPFSIGRAIWMFIHNCQDGKGMNGNDVARLLHLMQQQLDVRFVQDPVLGSCSTHS